MVKLSKLLFACLVLSALSSVLIACNSANEGTEPTPAKEGEYKTPDQVPGREGRTRAEAGNETR